VLLTVIYIRCKIYKLVLSGYKDGWSSAVVASTRSVFEFGRCDGTRNGVGGLEKLM